MSRRPSGAGIPRARRHKISGFIHIFSPKTRYNEEAEYF